MFFTTFLLLVQHIFACRQLTGIGTATNEVDFSTLLPPDSFFDRIISAIPNRGYEVPIINHNVATASIAFFNVLGSYEDRPLDFWGRLDVTAQRRACKNTTTAEYFSQHRQIAWGYTTYFGLGGVYNELDALGEELATFNLDPNICDDPNFNCSDITTPWGFAKIVTDEVLNLRQYNGWNYDGSYSRDFNRRPFEDFRENPYIPSNSPYRLRRPNKWQPLLESDGIGFLFNQEHVTPHIGFTGRSYFLTDEFYCSLEAPEPNYDYDEEIELLVQRLGNLTDKTKMEVELFDSKIRSIFSLFIQYLIRQGGGSVSVLDDWSSVWKEMILNIAQYEATLAVWRSKVLYNRVRPPSLIQAMYTNTEFETYAGTDLNGASFGTQTVLGRDFESYIRTMPHSEYPSASACFCYTFAEAAQLITGKDIILEDIGGPLVRSFAPLSSRREPLSTPSEEVTLTFDSWTSIAETCAMSRLNGGLHFTASIEGGEQLCRGIGTQVYNSMIALVNGELPEVYPNFDDNEIVEDKCNDFNKKSSSSLSSSSSSTGSTVSSS